MSDSARPEDDLGLSEKVAIVTGGGAPDDGIGNGRAAAMLLARSGVKVLVVDIQREPAEQTVAMIEAEGGTALAHVADVADEAQCKALVDAAVKAFGRLDLLDNNVGIGGRGSVVDTPSDLWRRVMTINVDSMFYVSKYAIPAMAESGGGAIVNVSSISALRPRGLTAYSTSKGAVIALTRAMAVDHGPQNIRVNCVAPGPIYTPRMYTGQMTPAGREARRKASVLGLEGLGWDIGHAVRFLLSAQARYITGQTLVVDGGASLVGPSRTPGELTAEAMRLRALLVVLALVAAAAASSAAEDELDKLVAQSDRFYNTGRYAEAVPVAERIVALNRERYGDTDPRYAAALNGLATFLQLTGALDRAEALLRDSLRIDLAALGPDHPDVATRQANLALVLLDKDNPAEAAELLHQALLSVEGQKTAPADYGATLSNFAAAMERLNRPKEAERLYRAALAAFEPRQGDSRAGRTIALGNLGILYKGEKRLDEAKPLLQQAVSILEALSTPAQPHPRLATALNNLATVLEDQQDFAAAEPLYRRALDLDRTMFGPDSPRLATRFANLGGMYVTQGRYDEAAKALKEAMRIDRAAYGDEHPKVAQLFLAGARLLSAKKEWEGAHTLIGRAVDIMIAADARPGAGSGRIEVGRDIPDVTLSQIVYETFLQVSGEWPWSDTSQFSKLGGPAFDVAQRLVTPAAAAAIFRMARRYASGDPRLVDAVRRQQDLSDQWNQAENRIIAQLAQPADRVDHDAVGAERAGQARTEQQLKSLDVQLQDSAQGYAALSGARVLTIARVQELLADDEALVYFAEDGVHIHAFFIAKQRTAWMPLPYTAATIAEHVQALRCGLDGTSWLDARAERCQQLLHFNYTDDDFARNEELPFDLARAHELYDALFGKLGGLVAGKRLIIVPTGALATLPFQVLVTEKPDPSLTGNERYRKAAWLVRQQAITVLPSVAALEALRRVVPRARAAQPFLGIGNPLLDGPPGGGDAMKQAVARARARQACAQEAPRLRQQIASAAAQTARGGEAGAGSVRELPPLPDTADELCAVAKDFGAGDDDVLLGARATKQAVLDLDKAGRLDGFAVVHFATHGLVSGELAGLAEPALALTPTDTAAADGNGLLTASEIAGLRLNADWVVLSSCNTAAGSADNNEAFSGLARAFFFAGTRALLVSHWQVFSEAAVALTTGAYQALRAEPSIGRAEALRRSMLAVLGEGGIKSRPAYWAPFVVVGDGG